MATILTASERRKRLKLKRIVVSEHNYLALKKVGYAGDSFNDVISKLLQAYRNYKEDKKKQEEQQHHHMVALRVRKNNNAMPVRKGLLEK